MKYINFKRNKFSTILKNINLSKLNLNRVYKHIYFRGYNFFKIYKYFDYRKYSFPKVYKYFDYRKYSFPKIYKYFDYRKYSFPKIYRYFDYRKYNFTNTFKNILLKFPKNTLIKIKKYTLIYALSFIILLFLIYSNIPAFYKYDKANIENVICKGLNIECTIKGKVSYIFFPTPRIKVKELTIKDTTNQNHLIGKIENTVIKVSYYNLLNKEKIKFCNVYLLFSIVHFGTASFKCNWCPSNFSLSQLINMFATHVIKVNLKYWAIKYNNTYTVKTWKCLLLM